MEAGEDVLSADVVNLALDRPPQEGNSSSLSDESSLASPGIPVTVVPTVEVIVGKQEESDDHRDDNSHSENGLNSVSLSLSERSSMSLTPSPSPASTPEKRFSCLKSRHLEDDKSPKRRVSFPDDSRLVTLSIDPIDPWKDGCAKSVAEVVSAYKELCDKLKTKANDKLVKQLQEIEELSNHLGTTTLGRCGTLSLKGIKLDNRACESLEAIFKRVQFENLDIENCSLEEEGATAILEMVEFYQSATRLNISCNPKIGFRGWQTLCRMLRKTPCLEFLDARRMLFSDQTMPMFGRCLKADPYLRILHLEGVYLSGRPILILATAMKYNSILQDLYLGDNDLVPSDGAPLATMLGANSSLSLLDLRNNSLKDAGLTYIGNGLKMQADNGEEGLNSLVMWNNGLTHEGMFYLCDALTKTKSLKSLNLGQNRLCDLGVQRLKPGLIRNKSLKRLGLLNTRLGSEGAVALAEVLADSDRLTRIDLRENNLHVAGLMALSLALKLNKTLLRMDLDKEMKKEQGLETVQQTVLADIYNYCQRNRQFIKECLSNESSVSDEAESPSGDVGSLSPDTTSTHENSNDNEPHGVVASIRNLVTEEGAIKNIVGTISTLAEMSTASPNPIVALPPPDGPQMGSGKSRFTITRIIESIGSASVDVANKFVTNVGLDAVAMKRLSRSLSKDEDSKVSDLRWDLKSSPVGIPGMVSSHSDMIQLSGVIATGSPSSPEMPSNSGNRLDGISEENNSLTKDAESGKVSELSNSLEKQPLPVIKDNTILTTENMVSLDRVDGLHPDRELDCESNQIYVAKASHRDGLINNDLHNILELKGLENGQSDLPRGDQENVSTESCKLPTAVHNVDQVTDQSVVD